jgi:hypothetical protein
VQSSPPAALRRNNRSAFFSRLLLRAKSAMAEILVSDLCECRPPLLIGGFFVAARSAVPWCLVFGSVSACFLAVLHCFQSIAFFLAITRTYIVFLQIFAL